MENSKNKLSTVQVLDTFYPNYDGPTMLVNNYARIQNLTDHCEVLVPKYPKYVDNQPYKVVRVKSMSFPGIDNYRVPVPVFDHAAKQYFKKNRFDLIHTHSPFTMGTFAEKMGEKYSIPVVFTLHTKYHEDFERLVKAKSLQKFMMKHTMKMINKADYVVTVSNATVQTLRDYGYKGNVTVIRNGTDLKYPENPAALIDKVNATYNLAGQKNVFLFVGRIVENKNVQLALKALKILDAQGVDFKMLIVGEGHHLAPLKELTKELELENKVIFTGKIMDRQFLSGHFLRSDLFLFPSTFDTASLVPLEAAAMKLPSLLVEGCSSSEIISDGFNGFTAKETPEAWAEKIACVIENPELLKSVSEECYRSVYRTWEDVTEEVLRQYRVFIQDYRKKHTEAVQKKKRKLGSRV